MTATHWTEPAIAAALEGRFYEINGKCRAEQRQQRLHDQQMRMRRREQIMHENRQRAEAALTARKSKLQRAAAQEAKAPTRAAIVEAVAWAHGLEVEDIRKQSRRNAVVRARQHACALMRELTIRSLPQIAEAVGVQDHTTALHSIQTWPKHRDRYAEQDRAARQMLGVG